MSGFDWNDSEAVATKPVRGVAAHWNNDEDIVIRVQANDEMHAPYDETIIIPQESLAALITRLIDMHKEIKRGET